jgi:hypothetical protein
MKITIRHDRVTAIGRKLSYKYDKTPFLTVVGNGDFFYSANYSMLFGFLITGSFAYYNTLYYD